MLVLVSLTAPAPSQEKIAGLTYQTTVREIERGPGMKWDVLLSLLVVVLVFAIWWYFSK